MIDLYHLTDMAENDIGSAWRMPNEIFLYNALDGLNLLAFDPTICEPAKVGLMDLDRLVYPLAGDHFYHFFLRSAATGAVIWQTTLFDQPEHASRLQPFLLVAAGGFGEHEEDLQTLFTHRGLEKAIEIVLTNRTTACYCQIIVGLLPAADRREDLATVYLKGETLVFGSPEGYERAVSTFPAIDQATTQRLRKLCEQAAFLFQSPCAVRLSIVAGKIYLYELRPLFSRSDDNERWCREALKIGLIDVERAWYLSENIITPRVQPSQKVSTPPIGDGNGNLPLWITGQVIFHLEKIVPETPQILLTKESQPIPYGQLKYIEAVVSVFGTNTSHAAIIASALGVLYVTGVEDLIIDTRAPRAEINGIAINEYEMLTIDGASGKIYKGVIAVDPAATGIFDSLLNDPKYADMVPDVLSNCDTLDIPPDLISNCKGFGLIRTEHLLNDFDNLRHIPLELYSNWYTGPDDQLYTDLVRMHEEFLLRMSHDFPGKSLCFRFFDFLSDEIGFTDLAEGIVKESMLGERGSRLGVLHNGLYEAQMHGLLKGVARAARTGQVIQVKFMLPFVAFSGEIRYFKDIFDRICAECELDEQNVHIKFGIMLEQPSLFWQLSEIAPFVDFISVGTNDLTQLSLGISRNTGGAIIQRYMQKGIINEDPFSNLETGGTWAFILSFLDKLRSLNPKIEFGICGVHAGIPVNIQLFLQADVDYLSVAPSLVAATYKALVRGRIFQKQSLADENLAARGVIAALCSAHLRKIRYYLDRAEKRKAQLCAFAWADEISSRLLTKQNVNWKFFKRDVCHHWYGKNEFRRFGPGWTLIEVDAYHAFLAVPDIRLSIFPDDIACHSISIKLVQHLRQEWQTLIPPEADKNWIEVFPNRSGNDICFRSYYSLDKYYFEFSEGQAMMAFEEQQGLHPIYHVDCLQDVDDQTSAIPVIGNLIHEFLASAAIQLAALHFDLITTLGFHQISVEGYITSFYDRGFMIVDIDTPFDIAFI